MPPTAIPPPVVMCNEHADADPLPQYPSPPDSSSAEALRNYAHLQQAWAIKAAGITEQLRSLRSNTAACLDRMRAASLIY